MIRGRKLPAAAGRWWMTADNGNNPPQNSRGLSQAWVQDRSSIGWPRTHAARVGRRNRYRGHRRHHRYRASARSKHWAWATVLSREARKVLDRQGPAKQLGVPALYEKLAIPREPAGGGRSASHHRGPGSAAEAQVMGITAD